MSAGSDPDEAMTAEEIQSVAPEGDKRNACEQNIAFPFGETLGAADTVPFRLP